MLLPTILTIDDDAVIRATICAAFQTHVCRVLQAANGPEGLALAQREHPDLILLDLALPGMDGLAVLAQLRADPDLYQVPVIMLTLHSQREHVREVLKLGISDYVIKPFTRRGLVERVERLLPLQLKSETARALQRFEQGIHILVVDDRPLILEQLQQSLSQTRWTVHGLAQSEEALRFCSTTAPHLILLSLSLPDDSGFTLFQLFRSHPPTRDTPILALVPKAALREQARAQQLGFDGFITKPIDLDGLPLKIARTLGLDSSRHYFQHRENCLVVTLPDRVDAAHAGHIGSLLRDKLRAEVEGGLQRVVLDFSSVTALDETLVRLAVRLMDFCAESELRFALVGTEALRTQCKELPETRDWELAPSFEAARAALEAPNPAAQTVAAATGAPAVASPSSLNRRKRPRLEACTGRARRRVG